MRVGSDDGLVAKNRVPDKANFIHALVTRGCALDRGCVIRFRTSIKGARERRASRRCTGWRKC
ncbi:hypothetical protein XFF6166_840072 [Xanthomonas citri pv. fuscans]|nr:hypothetical protein XFF6166_840072 [Xanthomonas citri pv. fuscans]SON98414.1 hypothetical protein XFF7767_1030072 [Xanthomonas citri pv. fuscans]SOO02547.1 hypothetical protein XFF6960_630084 [Xanthomonas citri pv. fuscans]SOO09709.1 hypothetical protein XFF6970_440082 [Xanthomonas citri pv. fuscans]SOO12882.1 hypothetical protein XFF7766_1140073 [Xanthomonas citri pv. fuscans]